MRFALRLAARFAALHTYRAMGAAAFEARRALFIPFADEHAPFGGELSQGQRWENEKMRA